MQRKDLPQWILTSALVFVFGYFGIDKLVHPELWIQWMPSWMEGLMGQTRDTWLMATGIVEIFFAILLLIPIRRVRQIGSIVIALHLLAILTQTGWNDIAIRDIGLLLSSLALFFLI